MRQAVVTVDHDVLSDRGLKVDVLREAGIRDLSVVSCEGSRGVLRVHLEAPVDEARLDGMDVVNWWEQVETEVSEHVYVFEAGRPDGEASSGDGDRHPRCERMEVSERGVTLTWAGPQDRLGEELNTLAAEGSVSLERLRAYRAADGPLDALTGRQREVLEVAYDRGYFDVPRDASVEGVAEAVGLDDSTVAEHLQRAERNLLGVLLGR